MMTIEEIRKGLADRIILKVSEATGLHYNTVRAIARGKTTPSYLTAEILSAYLSGSGGQKVSEPAV